MACHETKYCERCHATFECKLGNILQCQCNGIRLSDEEKEYLAAHYKDCLCRDCLEAIKQEARIKSKWQSLFNLLKWRK
ncbi:hypothetical protein COR50_19120 [Chitinophaga caeni]|uniref:Cysteine-rich CWC family protein n=1 Tax=Chitinophaga caeni TaxID=2029983 RepID=A0A291QZ02_9BACT|nr:cysteine-rich CWC family protein [Chitinophaga caeni]ATL49112.1 hypothetical protein COR50_19120 [Chitinophaga caeni]